MRYSVSLAGSLAVPPGDTPVPEPVSMAILGTGLLGSPSLPTWARGGVLPVAVLLVLKTLFDLATTRRALRPR